MAQIVLFVVRGMALAPVPPYRRMIAGWTCELEFHFYFSSNLPMNVGAAISQRTANYSGQCVSTSLLSTLLFLIQALLTGIQHGYHARIQADSEPARFPYSPDEWDGTIDDDKF